MELENDILDIIGEGGISQEKLRTYLRARVKRNISREQIRQVISELGDMVVTTTIDKSASKNGKTIICYKLRGPECQGKKTQR